MSTGGVRTADSRSVGNGKIVSAADLSGNVGYFGKLDANEAVILGTDNASDGVIADGGTASGDYTDLVKGRCWVKTGAADLTKGMQISCNASALAIEAASGDTACAVAETDQATSGGWLLIDYTGEEVHTAVP